MSILNYTALFPASLGRFAFPVALAALFLGACEKKPEPAPVVRSVRSVTVEKHEDGNAVVLTGQLRARDETSLAFRISGKMIQRFVDVGEAVKARQIVARLDDQMERNARTAAQADLTAARAYLEQSEAYEKRTSDLLKGRAVSRTEYEAALRQLKTAKAQVSAAEAKLKSADDQLGYTELKAEADGVITEKGAEPGEVVQAGRMVLTLARQSGRDAVFGVPAQVIREGLSLKQEAEVCLADNPDIKTVGHIREISPQADPATRNYQVKAALDTPPPGMFLGATVIGRLTLQGRPLVEIPSAALTLIKDKPAVWVFDAKEGRVHLRAIKIARYKPDSVIITEGLQPGERVVTAGVQELHEGQAVKLLGDAS